MVDLMNQGTRGSWLAILKYGDFSSGGGLQLGTEISSKPGRTTYVNTPTHACVEY
jgi:hypothetical protein